MGQRKECGEKGRSYKSARDLQHHFITDAVVGVRLGQDHQLYVRYCSGQSHGSRLISGLSYKIAVSKELLTSIFPL